MQKLSKVVHSTSSSFYKDYLSQFPFLTDREINVLSMLLEFKESGVKYNKDNKYKLAELLGISYSNIATVVHNMRHKGLIKGFIGGFVESSLYIPKRSTEISIKVIMGTDEK